MLPVIVGALASTALPPIALRCNASFEPFACVQGGAFTNPAVPLSPDPLVTYAWAAGFNGTDLQRYDVLPAAVALLPGTAPSAFDGLASVLTPNATAVRVTGAGGFTVDFGVESAAWVEIDVATPLAPADAALVRLGLSEWSEPLQNKWREPAAYAGGLTLRLETNAELYEGVRFGFVNFSAAPSAHVIITAVRAVAQTKPVNYVGAFDAAGDDVLTRIWYVAAYTVRVNLERDYFGAILVDRGDRASWTGDAHVAQATAMAAFGNFDFVLANLQRTKDDCNGIESYCVLWVLSLVDFAAASGNAAATAALTPDADSKLEHAQSIFNDFNTQLEFYSWDDRLGGGFSNGEWRREKSVRAPYWRHAALH